MFFWEGQRGQDRARRGGGIDFYGSPLQREFDKLLPTARLMQALDEAEELAKRLEERYMIILSVSQGVSW